MSELGDMVYSLNKLKAEKSLVQELKKTLEHVGRSNISLTAECEQLRHDIEAYRGALGYSVSGDHDGKLSDGTIPQCGICNSEWRKGLESENAELKAKLEKAESSLQFCRDWYSCRLERLSKFIREEIPEPQKGRYFSIIANGAADHMEQNTYGYQMNLIRIEKEQAESKVKELLAIVQLNHKYHKEGDDSARYSDSEVCAENTACLLTAMADDAAETGGEK